MKLIRFTHTRPLRFEPVPDGFGQQLIAGHPTRPAREWEVDSWLEEVAEDGDKQGAD